MAGRAAACSGVQATSSAPVRSTGIPAASAYSRSSALPRLSSRLSRVPGLASNPVCRIAVFALDVPVPTSRRRVDQHESSEYRASVAGDRGADHAGPDDHHVGPELVVIAGPG